MQNGFVDQCNDCQSLLEPLGRGGPGARAARERPSGGAIAFFERLGEMAAYPLRVPALLTLAGLALLLMFLRWVPILGGPLSAGLTLSLFFHIIQRTANGEEELEAPDFHNVADDVLAPIGRVTVAFSPILVGGLVFGWGPLYGDLSEPLAVAAIYGGVILLPLLLAIAAMGGSFLSIVNPLLWLESLAIMRGTYVAGALAFYVVAAAQLYVLMPLLAAVGSALSIPIVSSWLTTTVGLLPMAWAARLIGGMCEPYIGEIE